MSIYVGLDIHTRSTTVVAKTDRETCVMKKYIPNTPKDFERVVHQLREFDPHIIAGWVWTRNEPFKWEKKQRQQENRFAKTYVLNKFPQLPVGVP